jgi:acyl carrier protein
MASWRTLVDRKTFLLHLDELLEKPAGTLQGSESLEDLDGWDSVSLINFMELADEQFGRKVSPREVGKCETVNDLFSLVQPAA